MSIFETKTQEQQTDALAQYLPSGKAWLAKAIPTSTLRKMLLGLAGEFVRVQEKLNEVATEYYPDETTKLLSEWESALGIPDDCIPIAPDIEERRKNILIKFNASFTGTKADYEYLGELMGYDIEVIAAVDYSAWPWTWSHLWLGGDDTAPFRMVIKAPLITAPSVWPWTWPHAWGDDALKSLRCLFEKIKPANITIHWVYE